MRKLGESFSALSDKVKQAAAPFTMKHSSNNRFADDDRSSLQFL